MAAHTSAASLFMAPFIQMRRIITQFLQCFYFEDESPLSAHDKSHVLFVVEMKKRGVSRLLVSNLLFKNNITMCLGPICQ